MRSECVLCVCHFALMGSWLNKHSWSLEIVFPFTLTAMIRPLGTCLILSTTPYAPLPSSEICSRSSAFTSKFCTNGGQVPVDTKPTERGISHVSLKPCKSLLHDAAGYFLIFFCFQLFKHEKKRNLFDLWPTRTENEQPALPMENSTYLRSLK